MVIKMQEPYCPACDSNQITLTSDQVWLQSSQKWVNIESVGIYCNACGATTDLIDQPIPMREVKSDD